MATIPPPRLSDFEGRWRLTRRVRDFAGGLDGVLEGEAAFVADGPGLLYREAGYLRLGDAAPIRAERAYRWREVAAGAIAVAFADGLPFHSFAIADRAEATHWCDPDSYRVAYDFRRWPDWQTIWRVTGPRKDYEMTSRYSPLRFSGAWATQVSDGGTADGRGA